MRYFRIILFIFTSAIFISGCRNVPVTPADELLSEDWYVENQSGINATLEFDTENLTALLKISDKESTLTEICGVFAVDSKKLYIISEDLMHEYSFGYSVYADRLLLEYKGDTLTFTAKK